MKRKHTKTLCLLLSTVFCFSSLAPVYAKAPEQLIADRAAAKYTGTEDASAFIKISHPEKDTSSREFGDKNTDGLLDYVGNGKLGVPGVDPGANGQGDRGQSYSWSAAAYGDWMYVCTLFNASVTTMNLMNSGLDGGFDPEIMKQVLETCYRGDFFVEEEDGKNPRGTLSKVNVKTGEVKIIMSMDTKEDSYGNKYPRGINPQFRNAVKFNDKLYFCGSVNVIPAIYEVDPNNNDAFRCVYQDKSLAENPGAMAEAFKNKLCPAIRGITQFEDALVISCVGLDGNPYIAISKDPDKGFEIIASTWKEGTDNTVEAELLGYPACKLTDSIYGGSIWEMTEFDGDLYVAMCTGTPANSPDGGKTMQSFALIKGECNGDLTDRSAWTWTPIIGDKDKHGAAYTFGIDPERTRSGACNMMVFNDHLYIGEYNDTEIALLNFVKDMDLEFMADNLEQSVNLYRLDTNDTIEKVMGDPTELFPNTVSGSHNGSGFDAKENQYIWQMRVFDGKLYAGTFDETCILYPIAQFSNGDLLHMSGEEWKMQLESLGKLIQSVIDAAAKPKPEDKPEPKPEAKPEETPEQAPETEENTVPETEQDQDAVVEEEETDIDNVAENETAEAEDTAAEAAAFEIESYAADPNVLSVLKDMMKAEDTFSMLKQTDKFSEMTEVPAFSHNDNNMIPEACFTDAPIVEVDSFADMHLAFLAAIELLDQEDDLSFEQQLNLKIKFAQLYEEIMEYYEAHKCDLPQFIQDFYDKFLNNPTAKKVQSLLRCLVLLKDSESGFDMYSSADGVHFEQITNNGLGDPYNQGLRSFAVNSPDDAENNQWLTLGTANPFYGTQIWRMEGKNLNPNPVPAEPAKPQPETPEQPETPDKPSKPSHGGGGGSYSSAGYDIILKADDDIKLKASVKKADAGKTVSVTAEAENGKVVRSVSVEAKKDGKEIPVTLKDGKYTFEMPKSDVVVKAAAAEKVITLQINNKEIKVNDKTFTNDVAPVIVNDRTMVPIRVVTETLDGKVAWDAKTSTVDLMIDGKALSMTVGKMLADFDTPPVIMNERTYVPMRYIAEKLGADVQWIGDTKQIIIVK